MFVSARLTKKFLMKWGAKAINKNKSNSLEIAIEIAN